MHENRETSLPTARTSGSPAGEGESRTSGTHGGEESDGAVLPIKPANQATGKATEAAEVAEGRAPTKENVPKARAVPAQDGAAASQGLKGVRKAEALCRYPSKVRAVCVNRACTDLCGGCEATCIPTATSVLVVCRQPDDRPRLRWPAPRLHWFGIGTGATVPVGQTERRD